MGDTKPDAGVLQQAREALARGERIADADAVERWATAGDPEAQYVLGLWRERQTSDPWDAFEWFERAATQGHGPAAARLARLYAGLLPGAEPSEAGALAVARTIGAVARHWNGRAEAADEPTAALPAWIGATGAPDGGWSAVRAQLEALAGAGNTDAAYQLGDLLWRTGDAESPEAWLTRAAEGGHREAMHALGRWYLERFDEGHFDELLDPSALQEPLSEEIQDQLEWQSNLDAQERRRLLEQREIRNRALRWLRAAAERDDIEACVELADVLSRSSDEHRREAAAWYERAAQLGDVLSMVTVANVLRQGRSVPVDLEAAERWSARAAERFEAAMGRDDTFAPIAASQLAELHLRGHGVARDADRAVALFEQAGARGYAWALITLGGAYELGDGLSRDLARAEQCFARAVDVDTGSYARDRLDRVRARIREEAETTLVGETRVPLAKLRAAETGDAHACWEIARQLEVGGDETLAREWMQRAARSGHAVAAFSLSLDQPDDEAGNAESHRWRRAAAGLGHVTAMEFIGGMLIEPEEGDPIDRVLGYAWLAVASRERNDQPPGIAARGRANARACAATIWETLSPGEKARAERIVARCDAGPPYRLPDEVDQE